MLTGDAWDILRRKASQNLDGLVGSPLTLLIPVGLAALTWILLRPERFGLGALRTAYRRSPYLVEWLISLGVLLAVAVPTNDTGWSIPPTVMLFSVPVLIAVAARSAAPPRSAPAPAPARPTAESPG